MAVLSIQKSSSAIFLVVGILVLTCSSFISEVSCDEDCEASIKELADQCYQYVKVGTPKTQPSKECCATVKKVDIPCICKHIPKEVEKFVSMEKMVYVADFCGKALPHGSKCGSFTVPQA